MIFQNVGDMTRVIRELQGEGYAISRDDLATLSPYLTRHIKRFGDATSTWGTFLNLWKVIFRCLSRNYGIFIQPISYFGAYIGCTPKTPFISCRHRFAQNLGVFSFLLSPKHSKSEIILLPRGNLSAEGGVILCI